MRHALSLALKNRPARQLLSAMALSALSACASSTNATTSTNTNAVASTAKAAEPEDLPPALHEIAMGCIAGKADWTIGKQVDETLAAKARTDTEAKFVRVLRPGVPVTMEYNGARLNLHVNAKGMIERVSCG
jgi:hypothetical protein